MNITSKQKVSRLPASELKIHPVAQRHLNEDHVKYLIDHMNLDAIGILDAVDYPINHKPGPWIVDGQHRLRGLQGGWPNILVWYNVHIDVTDDAGAAQLFLDLNHAKPVSPYEKYTKKVIAGDPVALGVDSVLKQHHLKAGSCPGKNTASCVVTLQKGWQIDGGLTLSRSLVMAVDTWGEDGDTFDGQVLAGLLQINRAFNGEVDVESFKRKLGKHTPVQLIGKARSLKDVTKRSLSRCVAEVILGIYNSGKGSRTKLEL